MTFLFIMSIFYIVEGIFGLFGKMIIPDKFKGHDWTKEYIQKQGISYLLLGIPWLILYIAFSEYTPPLATGILLIVLLSVPAIVCTVFTELKYLKLLKK